MPLIVHPFSGNETVSFKSFSCFLANSFWETIILAGFPPATEYSGISFVTTLPAPIIQYLPILTPGKMIEPAPINVPSPIKTFPILV